MGLKMSLGRFIADRRKCLHMTQEELADKMTGQMDSPNPLLFAPAIQPLPGKLQAGKEMHMAVLHALKQDTCFEPLRGEERFVRLIHMLEQN